MKKFTQITIIITTLIIPTANTAPPPCPRGEYRLGNNECWPCEPGFFCNNINSTKTPCPPQTWSGRGFDACVKCKACEDGTVLIQACSPARGDAVCGVCPPGFECYDGVATPCSAGWYSSPNGTMCIRCPTNFSSEEGSERCECMRWNGDECEHCQAAGMVSVGSTCRPTPAGFGIMGNGNIRVCPANTFSTDDGKCTPCGSNAESSAGASKCDCTEGYVMTSSSSCTPCISGTVYNSKEKKCTLCTIGHFCLGKTHIEPCPPDTWAHRGAAMCSRCRINAWCAGGCTDPSNCTCDTGFVGSECTRCPERTTASEDGSSCIPCPPGKECRGGSEVWDCKLSTWSNGSVARCNKCQTCPEITATRCNATHDSVCERTTTPLAVINVYQQYKSKVEGETFAMFAMVYTASIPKATLLRICDLEKCIQCFQGTCPSSTGSGNKLVRPDKYEIVVQLRTDVHRLSQNLEALTQTAFLAETARNTMAKLTDQPFVFNSRVEHSIICPEEEDDDSSSSSSLFWGCQTKASKKVTSTTRTWLGLALAVLITASMLVCTAKSTSSRWGYKMPEQQHQQQMALLSSTPASSPIKRRNDINNDTDIDNDFN